MFKLKNDLNGRKYAIANFLYTFFSVVSFLAVVYQLLVLIFLDKEVSFIVIGLTLLVFVLFILARIFLVEKHLVLSTYILMLLLLAYAFFTAFTGGTSQPAVYILIAIVLVTTSIVISTRASIYIFLFFCCAILGITFLHSSGFVEYIPELTSSTYPSSIMFLILIFIFAAISYIGFMEIEYSYKKAYEYAEKLERLNANLEEEVAIKTKKIQEVFKKQSEVMYKQAVLGNITQALLHDIATPMSVVLGSTKLLEGSCVDDSNLQMIVDSVMQMDEIVENSKSLIKREDSRSKFSPREEVLKALAVLEKRIADANIKVVVDISEGIEIEGVQVLFNRLISNILINAIEELGVSNRKNKRIDIVGTVDSNVLTLEVKDNGRGISKDMVEHIFDAEFSSKDDDHLGFGLSFVRDIVEGRFGGSVEVSTMVGEYTLFVVKVPIY